MFLPLLNQQLRKTSSLSSASVTTITYIDNTDPRRRPDTSNSHDHPSACPFFQSHVPKTCLIGYWPNSLIQKLKGNNSLSMTINKLILLSLATSPCNSSDHQLIYSNNPSVPSALKNVVPITGPLHISLNARECVLLNFYQVFADLYSFLFGKKAKLAKKPKPWRISLLLEVIYGGWHLYVTWFCQSSINARTLNF